MTNGNLEELIDVARRVGRATARRFPFIDRDDVVAYTMEALCCLDSQWTPECGIPYEEFVVRRLGWETIDLLRRYERTLGPGRKGRQSPPSFPVDPTKWGYDQADDTIMTPEDAAEALGAAQAVTAALAEQSPRVRAIINEASHESLCRVACRHGMTESRVCQIRMKVRRRARSMLPS